MIDQVCGIGWFDTLQRRCMLNRCCIVNR